LPESTTFTLVDTLHGITLVFILIVIISTAFSLRMIKKDKVEQAVKFDKFFSIALLAVYLFLNAYFIWQATKG
jgi:hypothetical protein